MLGLPDFGFLPDFGILPDFGFLPNFGVFLDFGFFSGFWVSKLKNSRHMAVRRVYTLNTTPYRALIHPQFPETLKA